MQSPRDYARICNAVVRGSKPCRSPAGSPAARPARAATTSRETIRSSISPLPFLRGMKRWGAAGFDAYAHHPYYGTKSETPRTRLRRESAACLDGGDARQLRRARPRAHATVWQQAGLDHRVRLPDESARSDLRRHVREGRRPTCARRTSTRAPPPHRPVPLVPNARRAESERLAVRPATTTGQRKPAFNAFRTMHG